MGELAESGAALAWRVLATLEGGALVAGGAVLLAYRWRAAATADSTSTAQRAAESVLVTNTSSPLGAHVVQELESQGCSVTSLESEANQPSGQFDALVVIGASPMEDGLTGLSDAVNKDVYDNLKVLETQTGRVRRGGRVVWAACTGDATGGAFSGAYQAFDNVLKAQLQLIAKEAECVAVWVERCSDAQRVAQLVAAAMLPASTISVRNITDRVRGYVEKWLKIKS